VAGHTEHLVESWLAALERRHTASLTSAELTRALRALSSCYVERRGKLGGGAALEGAGKRAAFALFYGPIHFLTITEIVRALDACTRAPDTILDLGCGTGVGGAAWALACGARPRVTGIDRSAWAVGEAAWTYGQLGVRGTARTADVTNATLPSSPESAVLLAYAVNELDAGARGDLLRKLVDAVRGGTRVLVVEAIALRDKPWWPEWTRVLEAAGARSDEWRFDADISVVTRELARRAGLTLKELTARTICAHRARGQPIS
jgi:SAM-dependent methyltransferase